MNLIKIKIEKADSLVIPELSLFSITSILI